MPLPLRERPVTTLSWLSRSPARSPMLDTSFVLWLQQWASPALTEIMRAVSLWGYVPSCLAVAIVCGFGGRLGVTLILALSSPTR